MKQKSIGINAILNGGKTVLNMLFPTHYLSICFEGITIGKPWQV